MRVDLRDDEMIDVEHFCESGHGQIVIHRAIDPTLRSNIPRLDFAGLRILCEEACR